ncbi:MAG: hypothetical protein WAU10_03810, partial [Caldilineaceae bacterium]
MAAGIGLFAASATGGNFRLIVNGTAVSLQAPARGAAVATEPETAPQTVSSAQPAAQAREIPPPSPAEAETPAPVAPPRYTADSVYFNEIAADISLLVVSLKRLEILLSAPRPEEEGWRSEIGIVTGAVRLGADNLARVRPSDASMDTHSFLMSATNRCGRVALALDGDLSRLPVETFQLIGDTLAGCTGDVVSV